MLVDNVTDTILEHGEVITQSSLSIVFILLIFLLIRLYADNPNQTSAYQQTLRLLVHIWYWQKFCFWCIQPQLYHSCSTNATWTNIQNSYFKQPFSTPDWYSHGYPLKPLWLLRIGEGNEWRFLYLVTPSRVWCNKTPIYLVTSMGRGNSSDMPHEYRIHRKHKGYLGGIWIVLCKNSINFNIWDPRASMWQHYHEQYTSVCEPSVYV